MDANETPIYHAVIASGIVLMLFNFIFVCCSIWMQRRLIIKNREREEAVMVRMEKERMRIAVDLHDATGPLIYQVKRIIENVQPGYAASRALLDRGQEILNALSEQLHTLSKSMVPLSLERKGLRYSLEEMILENEMQNNLIIPLQCGDLEGLNTVAETHIYRILQEIIQNTVKHSQASRLKILINRQDDSLLIKTNDNGKGCNIEKLGGQAKGLGIGNIKTRASFMQGSAVMRSVNGFEWQVNLKVGKKH